MLPGTSRVATQAARYGILTKTTRIFRKSAANLRGNVAAASRHGSSIAVSSCRDSWISPFLSMSSCGKCCQSHFCLTCLIYGAFAAYCRKSHAKSVRLLIIPHGRSSVRYALSAHNAGSSCQAGKGSEIKGYLWDLEKKLEEQKDVFSVCLFIASQLLVSRRFSSKVKVPL